MLSITSKTVPYAFINLVLCVVRWGTNKVDIWTSASS